MSAQRRQADGKGSEFIALAPLRHMRVTESINGGIEGGRPEESLQRLTEDIYPQYYNWGIISVKMDPNDYEC
jgi:hypothetical protein